MTDFKTFLEDVRSRADIVDVISADVDLRPAGSTLKGLSPFRQESNPSFVVWPSTQSWHDFSNGGGLGGDVFDYVQHRENVGLKEAVFILAQRFGVRRPNQDDEAWKREISTMAERREVEQLLTKAAAYYHRILPGEIREDWYHRHYGFTDETINDLQLGWADGNLFEHFTKELGVAREMALKTGLFIVSKAGHVHDFFCKRLAFPYWRAGQGQVVYFIARRTEATGDQEWEKPKYKKLLTHSKDHDYVSPTVGNDYIYNEGAARDAEELLITEGITDCISAQQAGIACISPATTSFRNQDVPRLLQISRNTKRIIICNDAESNGAGEAGALKTAAALWREERDVRVALIPRPEGQDKIDINELVVKSGPEALRQVLAAAKTYPEYLLERIPLETAKSDLDRMLTPVLDALVGRTPIATDAILDAVASKFSVRRAGLVKQLKELSSKNKVKAVAKRAPTADVPEIRISGRQLRDIVDEARDALVSANEGRVAGRGDDLYLEHDPPLAFRRGGRVVYLKVDDGQPPELSQLSDTGMVGLLTRNADFVSEDDEGASRPSFPPRDVARHLIVFPPRELPLLDSVITTPVFGKRGALIVEPGYHAEDSLWLHPDPSLHVPEVPQAPTPDDITHARSLFLDDLFTDFRLVGDADKAHTIAALLLPFARRLIQGNTPLHVVEAPSIGSGKGLLCNLISIVCTGRVADVSTLPAEEEEVRKTLTAELLKAQPIIVIDNAKERKVIDSQALTSALTAVSWRSRILGKTEMIVLPNYAMWMLTGNNPRLSGELCRRAIRIRMDPKQDQAWRRTDFKHDPVTVWATENRSELVHAALVLVQAWIAAGMPLGKKRLGSFEHWAAVMDGLLDVVGMPDFLGNLDNMYADADAEGEPWREFTIAWWDEHQDRAVRVKELNAMCEKHDLMSAVRGEITGRPQEVRLGKALMGARDRVYGELRVTRQEGDKHRGSCYVLEHLGSGRVTSGMTMDEPEVDDVPEEQNDEWT